MRASRATVHHFNQDGAHAQQRRGDYVSIRQAIVIVAESHFDVRLNPDMVGVFAARVATAAAPTTG